MWKKQEIEHMLKNDVKKNNYEDWVGGPYKIGSLAECTPGTACWTPLDQDIAD